MPIDLIDTIRAKNSGDFAMVEDVDILGGFQVVADLTARNNIPTEKRKEGMRVKVAGGNLYELSGGILNGNWVQASSSSTAAVITETDIIFPVDYNDGSAVDPTTEIFSTQAQVDDFLALAGATNFKHLQAVYDALPLIIGNDITINCATGVHRPVVGQTTASWNLEGKLYSGGTISVIGSSPSTWPVLSGLSAIAVLSTTGAGTDPKINFTGTPFTGLDLKGRYAVADTGQVFIIHDNDASSLSVLKNPSPAPSSITVTSSPGTIFRNSQTDLALSAQNSIGFSFGGSVSLQNLTVDPFSVTGGTSTGLRIQNMSVVPPVSSNVMIDNAAYNEITGGSVTGQNVFIIQQVSPFVQIHGLIHRPPPVAFDTINFLYQITDSSVFAFSGNGWYLRGCRFGAIVSGIDKAVTTLNVVYDEVGQVASGIQNTGGVLTIVGLSTILAFSDFSGGKISEIRGFRSNSSSHATLLFRDGSGGDSSVQRIVFSDNTMDLVRIEDDSYAKRGRWINGGSNTGVGFDINGPRATIELDATDVDITGTLGDIRVEGIIGTYGDLPVLASRLITENLNFVSKG